MDSVHVGGAPPSFWFVGANWDGTEDQTPRFHEEGIWENGYDDRYIDEVRSMRPGERIAIKSTYTRKRDLPFDNRGEVAEGRRTTTFHIDHCKSRCLASKNVVT